MWLKSAIGAGAGALASVIGTPADLALVRIQADRAKPVAQRVGYSGLTDVLRRVAVQEGVPALWRGTAPVVLRAACMNASMLPVSDQVKEVVGPHLGGQDSTTTLVVSALAAGLAASSEWAGRSCTQLRSCSGTTRR